jgi:2-polyprenyl-6-methoxyphenol hydroxylase-like FAD-dependent oxidoreductase
MDVLVAGGGIAGLTMALSCEQIGMSVSVLEAAFGHLPFGLGISLQPDAVRELEAIGLGDDVAARAVEIDELVLVSAEGAELWRERRGRPAGYQWPQYAIPRGDLQKLLVSAVHDRLGDDVVRLGHSVTGYEHGLAGVRVQVEGHDDLDALVLVGADGLRSKVRARMYPGDGGPRWGGSVLWRGCADGPTIHGGRAFTVIGGESQRFITFPISPPDPSTGRQRHNWIAELAFDPKRGWRRGDWNTQVAAEEFVGAFEGWRIDDLDVVDLVNRSTHIYEYPMVDRDPVDHWVHGSVALIGDAAHVTYSIGSNGASQAIVDARVLAGAFQEHGVNRDALRAYESRLLASRSDDVLRNRSLGPGSILGIVDVDLHRVFAHLGELDETERVQLAADHRAEREQRISDINDAPPLVGDAND